MGTGEEFFVTDEDGFSIPGSFHTVTGDFLHVFQFRQGEVFFIGCIDDGLGDGVGFAIPAKLQAKQKISKEFLAFCKERAEVRKYSKAEDSKDRYDRFIRFLENYGRIKSFYDLTEAKVMELDRYLKSRNGMKAKSRWNNYHRFLNSFILDAKMKPIARWPAYRSRIGSASGWPFLRGGFPFAATGAAAAEPFVLRVQFCPVGNIGGLIALQIWLCVFTVAL